ncbi:hypothetical protein [Roseimaritima ulvae]|uniref:Uncharacterized protein n=1 Tax=Roseimaritima ulvae TaxID=980254 RepID=A0A5B9QX80_9BACT|nr:hypothetical protein [Roseimaritima ulvae]QEG38563.1 hypothetical protein UC8_05200 [Roseimaritima ulvae]
MIVFQCEECGTQLQALDENAGKKARCQCGAVMPVPPLSSPSPAAFDPAPYQPSDPLPTLDEYPPVAPSGSSGPSVGSMMWGFCLMAGGVLWFVASLANGRTSASAIVLFIIGLFRVIGAFNKE